jgi:hypothetical protein
MFDPQGIYTGLLVLAVLVAVVGVFLWISQRVRRGGGSLTTIVMGATDEFLSKDSAKAAEIVVEQHAGKKLEEQGSEGTGLPERPSPKSQL